MVTEAGCVLSRTQFPPKGDVRWRAQGWDPSGYPVPIHRVS